MRGMRGCRRAAAALTALAWLLPAMPSADAAPLRFCDRPAELTAAEQDRILQFAAIVKAQLAGSGHRLALLSRSGLDLRRFGVRYTHAGVSLQANRDGPWSVRQLYFACTEQRPRIFDQGVSGFLMGLGDPASGFVSAVLLPDAAEAAVERAVLDDRRALRLLGARYSANAHAFSAQFQNCNQWIAEMLADAWAAPGAADAAPREAAQQWLRDAGYRPEEFRIDLPPPRWLGAFFPLLHHDDHPPEDLDRNRMRVSMPSSIEAFVRQRLPAAQRLEFCFTPQHVVIRRGWQAIGDDCRPAKGDAVVAFAAPR